MTKPTTRKLILIPDYKPLYAMEKCYGPTHGPLSKPCPTPVDIIGKLLLQGGKEQLTIYEVVPDPANSKKMLPPVKLTLDNYTKSYFEITKECSPDTEVDTGRQIHQPIQVPKRAPVAPTVVRKTPSAQPKPTHKIIEISETAEVNDGCTTIIVPQPAPAVNIPMVIEMAIELDDSGEERIGEEAPMSELSATANGSATDEAVPAQEEADPYANMTRAERKRARREAAQAAAADKEAVETTEATE